MKIISDNARYGTFTNSHSPMPFQHMNYQQHATRFHNTTPHPVCAEE